MAHEHLPVETELHILLMSRLHLSFGLHFFHRPVLFHLTFWYLLETLPFQFSSEIFLSHSLSLCSRIFEFVAPFLPISQPPFLPSTMHPSTSLFLHSHAPIRHGQLRLQLEQQIELLNVGSQENIPDQFCPPKLVQLHQESVQLNL